MTTPVILTGSTSGTMSFILPKEVVDQGAPHPSNPDVTVHTMPAARYACYCFSGSGDPVHCEKAAGKLSDWVAAHHLSREGTPLFAYYNPPWTPGFLRRNEVLIRIGQEP